MQGYIVTADDYGLAREFNRGILELAHTGRLSGISVMINRKYIRKNDLLSLPQIDLGIHLELPQKTTQKEILTQIRKFKKKFGRFPDYLDGHQHCHLSPLNIHTVIAVAKRYRLPVRSRFSTDRVLLRDNGIGTPDAFIAWHPAQRRRFFNHVSEQKGLAEIVSHPGYFDSHTRYPYNEEREHELKILKGRAFWKLLRNAPQIRYSEIRK